MRSIQSAQKAASAVYANFDIRLNIFKMVDRTTLTRMMRLNKDSMWSVAKVLYREIPVSLVSKMSRTPVSCPPCTAPSGDSDDLLTRQARRAVYSDAVQIINRNPPHLAASSYVTPWNSKYGSTTRIPRRVNPTKLMSETRAWLKKFKSLNLIINEIRSHESDDTYTVCINGSKIAVDIETPIKVDLWSSPETPHTTDKGEWDLVCPTLVFGKWEVQHTISLFVVIDSPYIRFESAEQSADHVRGWKRRFYANPNLDPRIRSFRLQSSAVGWLNPTFEDNIALVTQRRLGGCPLTTFQLGSAGSQYRPEEPKHLLTHDDIRRLAEALGPDLRTLRLSYTMLANFESLQIVFDELDRYLPNLENLAIFEDVYGDSPNLRLNEPAYFGLPNLRIFDFCHIGVEGEDIETRATRFHQLGRRDCVFI